MRIPPFLFTFDVGGRLLAVVMVVIGMLVVWGLVPQSESRSSLTKLLDQQTAAMAPTLRNVLLNELETVQKLAIDPRFVEAQNNTTEGTTLLRRVLYEYSYLNKVPYLYTFFPKDPALTLRTTAAPELTESANQFLLKLFNRGARPAAAIVVGKDTNFFLTAIPLKNATGGTAGFVVMLQNLPDVLLKLNFSNAVNMSGMQLMLSHRMADDKIGLITFGNDEKFTLLTSAQAAPFKGQNSGNLEINITEPRLASLQTINGFSNFAVVASAPIPQGNALGWVYRVLVVLGGVVLLLVVALTPVGNGVYSRALKQIMAPPAAAQLASSYQAVAEPPSPDDPDFAYIPAPKPEPQVVRVHAKKAEAPPPPPKKNDQLPTDIVRKLVLTAVSENRTGLVYQPLYASENGDPQFVEVLLRIFDHRGEAISPGVFIPIAEKENMMADLDAHVVETVMKKHVQGANQLPIPLALNISGNTFAGLKFLESLMSQIAQGTLDPSRVVFELQAKEIVGDKKAMDFIKDCQNMGFRFAIDYFGGEAVALKAAKALGFTYVKVNAQKFAGYKNSVEIQKQLVRLSLTAKQLALPLVLEKVENSAMAKFAVKVGFPLLQGYVLSPPKAEISLRPRPVSVL